MRTSPEPLAAALVTGAASGVGRYAAAELAARGTRVAAIDIDEDGLRALAASSPLVTPFVCDVGDQAATREAVQDAHTTVGSFGQVVHCAGIAALGRVLEQSAADFERAMRVNYLGTVHVARAAVPFLTDRGGGSFIAIASIAGWIPLTDIGAYSASKAAVIAFCEVLAAECRRAGIQVVCVCPAAVETPMLQGLRRDHPDVINDRPGLPPAAIYQAAQLALRRGQLFSFPGRGTKTLWRARRTAPVTLTRLLDTAIKRQRASSGGPASREQPAPGKNSAPHRT
ncbi:SDR family NAD(P)-dependent oxidoreductase [Kitasatospora sp. NPDC059599]|uniref:SDR family NAD(P)-dependent oxidoreductase n=1 Tax=Kitasatospora sp. NPDC059599 TaxID=3346880 RepID=UPI00367A3214